MENNNDIQLEENKEEQVLNEPAPNEFVGKPTKFTDEAYKDVTKVNPGEVMEAMSEAPFSKIILPSTSNKTVNKRDAEISDVDFDNLTLESSQAITLDRLGGKYNASSETLNVGEENLTVSYDTFNTKLNESDVFTNQPSIAGKDLNIKAMDPDKYSKPGVKTDQLKLFYKLMAKSNKGDRIIVPLWHSGFKIIVRPPTPTDILGFYNKLTKELSEVGANTMGLIYSNYTSLTHKYFLELLMDLLDSSTLQVSLMEDNILDYISILDLNILYLAVISSITRQGLSVNVNCNNVNVIEDGKPKCDFSASCKLDPTKILWVNDSQIPEWMVKQISTNGSGSVGKQEVIKYQQEVYNLIKDKSFPFTPDTIAIEAKVILKIPTLSDYLSESEYWRNEVTRIVRDSLTSKYTPSEKEQMIQYVTYIMRMVSYNSFVKGIEAGGEMLDERELVSKALMGSTTGETDNVNTFIRNILKFIEDGSIAIVAIPSFTCPNCKAEQHAHSKPIFKELIPLAMETLFFDLAARITVGKAE